MVALAGFFVCDLGYCFGERASRLRLKIIADARLDDG